MDSFGSVRSWVRGGRYEWLSSASLPGQVFPGCCQKRRRPNRSGFGAWIVYDVVLNPRRMGAGTACETVARLTECEEFTPTAESLRAMQNLRLASRVRARLATDPRTREGQLEAQPTGGS